MNNKPVTKMLKCKCCWKSITNSDYSLIYSKEGKSINLEKLLLDCLGRIVKQSDGINQAICNTCFNQLVEISEFKLKCSNNAIDDEDYDEDDDNIEIIGDLSKNTEDILIECDDDVEYLDVREEEEEEEKEEEKKEEKDEPFVIFETNTESYNKMDEESIVVEEPIKKENELKNKDEHISNINVVLKNQGLSSYNKKPKYNIFNTTPIKKKTKRFTLKPSYKLQKNNTNDEKNISGGLNELYENIEYLDDLPNNAIDPFHYQQLVHFESIIRNNKLEEFVDPFPCSLCNTTFNRHIDLLQHTTDYHCTNKLYCCIVDDKCAKFLNLIDLNEHILTKHYDIMESGKILISCLTCKRQFENKFIFVKHMCCTNVENPNEIELECSVCAKIFTSKKRKLFHHQFHLDNPRPKVCLVCLKYIDNEDSFYNHVMFSHEHKKIFFCQLCDKVFMCSKSLEVHQRIHYKIRMHECTICNKSFLNKQTLGEHSITHLKKKPYKCHICDKTLNRGYRLRKHIMSHEKPIQNNIPVCVLCSTACSSEEDIDVHYKKEHPNVIEISGSRFKIEVVDIVYCCEYCERAYTSKSLLLSHRKKHNNCDVKLLPFQCDICESRYDTYSKLKTHKIIHGINNKFPVQRHYLCLYEYCQKSYRHWPDLNNHLKVFHNINQDQITCSLCDLSFLNSWTLAYHKKTVHFKKDFQCNCCNETFNTKKKLEDHAINHVKSEDVDCSKCGKKFQTKFHYNQHKCKMNIAFVCALCSKKFPHQHALNLHQKTDHVTIENHLCQVCNQGFPNLKDKITHMRDHTLQKPYHCSDCSYVCRTGSMLIEHYRIHTDERPFKCPLPTCDRKFKRVYAMKNHFKLHTGERNYVCMVNNCSKTFRSRSDLTNHIKKLHPNEKVPKFQPNEKKPPIMQNVAKSFKVTKPNKSSNEQKEKGEGDHNYILPTSNEKIQRNDNVEIVSKDNNSFIIVKSNENNETIEFLDNYDKDNHNDNENIIINHHIYAENLPDATMLDQSKKNIPTSLNGVIVQVDENTKQLVLSDGQIISFTEPMDDL